MLRLLHLSDIHFQESGPGVRRLDLDAEVRQRLLNDLARLVEATGPCDAVLVVGDIGARGTPEDYREAKTFLKSVTGLVGCGTDRVVCVPGNHDVNRRAHTPTHDAIRHHLRTCPPREINDRLLDHLQDPLSGALLLEPFHAYNEFALAFGCDISAKAPTWDPKTLPLGDKELVIHGVNSAWIADGNEDDQEDANRLIAGTFQLIPLGERPDDVHMTLCHHPVNWLRDAAELEDWGGPAHLMLTGHEHDFGMQVRGEASSLAIASGAVNPSRGEDGWYPAYNLIELDDVDPGSTHLEVRLHVRSWSQGRFQGDLRFGDPERVVLDLTRGERPPAPPAAPTARPLDGISRTHVYRVMGSAPERRRALAAELGMRHIPDPGLDGDREILHWAAEEGMLGELAARVVGDSADG